MRTILRLLIAALLAVLRPSACPAADLNIGGTLAIRGDYIDFRPAPPPGAAATGLAADLRLELTAGSGDNIGAVVILDASSLDPGAILFHRAYLDLALSAGAFLRLGQQKIAWGTGFAWNPTNYLGADKNRADLSADSAGVMALDLEAGWEKIAGAVAIRPADNPGDWGLAGRIGLTRSDLSLSGFVQGDRKGVGGDISLAAGDWVVHAEAAWKAGYMRAYVNDAGGTYEILTRPGGEFFCHGVLGAYRNFAGGWFALIEYYHNGEGWTNAEAAAYFAADRELRSDPRLSADFGGELRRNYLFCQVRKDGFCRDGVSAGLGVLYNLDDGSYLLTPELSYAWRQDLSLGLRAGLFHGAAESEFGSSPVAGTITAELEMAF